MLEIQMQTLTKFIARLMIEANRIAAMNFHLLSGDLLAWFIAIAIFPNSRQSWKPPKQLETYHFLFSGISTKFIAPSRQQRFQFEISFSWETLYQFNRLRFDVNFMLHVLLGVLICYHTIIIEQIRISLSYFTQCNQFQCFQMESIIIT